MDWNRDGKVDAHDAALYHMVINNDGKAESGSYTSSNGRSYSGANKPKIPQTPAASSDSSVAGWIIAAVVIALLFFFM